VKAVLDSNEDSDRQLKETTTTMVTFLMSWFAWVQAEHYQRQPRDAGDRDSMAWAWAYKNFE
jgi:hypothetical protein